MAVISSLDSISCRCAYTLGSCSLTHIILLYKQQQAMARIPVTNKVCLTISNNYFA